MVSLPVPSTFWSRSLNTCGNLLPFTVILSLATKSPRGGLVSSGQCVWKCWVGCDTHWTEKIKTNDTALKGTAPLPYNKDGGIFFIDACSVLLRRGGNIFHPYDPFPLQQREKLWRSKWNCAIEEKAIFLWSAHTFAYTWLLQCALQDHFTM